MFVTLQICCRCAFLFTAPLCIYLMKFLIICHLDIGSFYITLTGRNIYHCSVECIKSTWHVCRIYQYLIEIIKRADCPPNNCICNNNMNTIMVLISSRYTMYILMQELVMKTFFFKFHSCTTRECFSFYIVS